MNTTSIKLTSITWPQDRKRAFSDDNVQRLKLSIKTEGLKQPIIVRRINEDTYVGIAGRHRFEACKKLGHTHIPTTLQPDHGDQELNQIADGMTEIDENLARQTLSALEEGDHYLEREELLVAREARLRVLEVEAKVEEAKEAQRAAKSKEEKAAARKAVTATAAELTKAKKGVCQKTKELSESGRQPVRRNRKGTQQAMAEAVEISGKSERLVQMSKRNVKTAREVAKSVGVSHKALAGSSLDKGEELRSLEKLAKHQPETAKRIVKAAASGKEASATGALKVIKGEQEAEKRKTEASTEAGRYKQVGSLLTAALSQIKKAHELASTYQLPKSVILEIGKLHKAAIVAEGGVVSKGQIGGMDVEHDHEEEEATAQPSKPSKPRRRKGTPSTQKENSK